MEIMTVDEVVNHTRLRKKTVLKLLRSGDMPGRKIGGEWRTTKELVDGWQEKFYKEG